MQRARESIDEGIVEEDLPIKKERSLQRLKQILFQRTLSINTEYSMKNAFNLWRSISHQMTN